MVEYKYLSVHLEEMLNNSIPDSSSSRQASHIHTVTMMSSYATLHVLNFSISGSLLSYSAYVYVCHYGSGSDVVKSNQRPASLSLFALWSRNTDEPSTHQTSFTCIAALLEKTHRCKD